MLDVVQLYSLNMIHTAAIKVKLNHSESCNETKSNQFPYTLSPLFYIDSCNNGHQYILMEGVHAFQSFNLYMQSKENSETHFLCTLQSLWSDSVREPQVKD